MDNGDPINDNIKDSKNYDRYFAFGAEDDDFDIDYNHYQYDENEN